MEIDARPFLFHSIRHESFHTAQHCLCLGHDTLAVDGIYFSVSPFFAVADSFNAYLPTMPEMMSIPHNPTHVGKPR
eukprot:m.21261 g.21261  ORF g.21261 m.21261 type:complete len:76 (-) comp8266_c0_seq3:15-242(-)